MKQQKPKPKYVLSVHVFFDDESQAAALLQEVAKDIWDSNDGSIQQGNCVATYATRLIQRDQKPSKKEPV